MDEIQETVTGCGVGWFAEANVQRVRELQALITRACSGFRVTYGPNSTQYEQAGGVRSSERKSRGVAKAAKAATATV